MIVRICHQCSEDKSKLDFCVNCHKWTCVDCIYKATCLCAKDGMHSPASAVKIKPIETEIPLISEMVH
jgi:hypothetical protein